MNRGSLSYLLILLFSVSGRELPTLPPSTASNQSVILGGMTWPPTGQSYTHMAMAVWHGGSSMPHQSGDLWQACFALMYRWGHDLGAPPQISNPFFAICCCESVNVMHSPTHFHCFWVCLLYSFVAEWRKVMYTWQTTEWYRYMLLQILLEILQFLQLLSVRRSRSWGVLDFSRRGEKTSSFSQKRERERKESTFENEVLEISFTKSVEEEGKFLFVLPHGI
jgi:hypothetical protein